MSKTCGLVWVLGLSTALGGCGESGAGDGVEAAGAAGLPVAGLAAAGVPAAGAAGVLAPTAGDGVVTTGGAGGAAGALVADSGAGGVGGPAPVTGGTGILEESGGSGGAPPATGGAGGTPPATGGAGAGGTAGAAPPMTTPCTGKPGGNGNETRTAMAAQYIVHFPSGVDPNQPIPVVFVDHGFTMSGALMQSLTGFDAVADREGFVVVYPNGDGGAFPWNVGVGACAPGGLISAGAADSIGYHEEMLASVQETQCINPAQVFVTGFSMGGYFANHMGCQAGNSFARAVGPHSGGTYPGDCPGAPVPIFIMHGAADTFIDHTLCGQGARDLWLPRNGCDSNFETRPVMGGSCEWYSGCDPNGQTVYCEFAGVGHAWASGATAAVWDFFKAYL